MQHVGCNMTMQHVIWKSITIQYNKIYIDARLQYGKVNP